VRDDDIKRMPDAGPEVTFGRPKMRNPAPNTSHCALGVLILQAMGDIGLGGRAFPIYSRKNRSSDMEGERFDDR